MASQGEFVLPGAGHPSLAGPGERWTWVYRTNQHGKPMVEGESERLHCMVLFSRYRPGLTSTTFWPPGQRWTGDHFLKGERTETLEAAIAYIEGHSVEELLRRSLPRLQQMRRSHKPAVRRSDARMPRCVICGGSNAFFGFGPPLIPELVWTCAEHRRAVDPG
jgi:hypothetical protein